MLHKMVLKVINISSGFLPSSPDLSVLASAVNSAVNGHGVVIVASAGNSGSNRRSFK